MTVRRWPLVVGYPILTFLAGGKFGLLVGLLVVVPSWFFTLSRKAFWIASLACLAAAPFALILQGLPATPVPGPGFGTRHLLAHALVGLAMALAAWAALRDLAEGPYDPNFSIRQMLKMRLFRRGPETRALDN